ncbi:MAG: hypothetical protein KJ607_06665 [Bacteroidetes bacterium]|nr:hypothetical protein [Bacteroidota bacterium]
MKPIHCFLIVIALFVLVQNAGYSQQTEKKTVVAAELSKVNVVYRGLDNPLLIAVTDAGNDEITVVGENCSIAGSAGEYIIRPGTGPVAKVNVVRKEKDGDKRVAVKEFRVKDVPSPVAAVAGKKGGVIKKEELISAGKIMVLLENFAFDLTFEVVSFKVVIKAKSKEGEGDSLTEELSESSTFTKYQLNLIESLQPDSRISFEEIKAKGPDGKIRELGAISFKIIP